MIARLILIEVGSWEHLTRFSTKNLINGALFWGRRNIVLLIGTVTTKIIREVILL